MLRLYGSGMDGVESFPAALSMTLMNRWSSTTAMTLNDGDGCPVRVVLQLFFLFFFVLFFHKAVGLISTEGITAA
jgi:hypothetical protein